MTKYYEPREYQRIMINFMLRNLRCNVFASPGTGKTSSSLYAFDAMRMFGEAKRALVLAPKRVAMSTWPNEVALWSNFNHLSIAACVGSEAQRIAVLKRQADITTINYEQLPWLMEVLGDHWPFDTVFADECFVAGTLVTTARGDVPIEQVVVGDMALTRKGFKKVTHAYTKHTESLVEVRLHDGARIVCTPRHQFWTQGGWKDASQLGQSDLVYKALPLVRKVICDSTESASGRPEVGPILPTGVQHKTLACRHTCRSIAEAGHGDAGTQRRERCVEHGAPLGRGDTCEAAREAGRQDDVDCSHSWRQWQGNVSARDTGDPLPETRLGVESPDTNQADCTAHGRQTPTLLQAGLRMASGYALLGSGRQHTPHAEGPCEGREENICLRGVGVDSVANLECRGRTTVYDLEVADEHEYFAGAVLVHNCTRLKGLRITLQTSKLGNEFVRGQGSTRAKSIAHVAHKKVRRWISLTGSPAPNGVIDLWGQCWFIDQGMQLGRSFTAFEDRFLTSVPTSEGYTRKVPVPGAQQIIEQLIKPYSIAIDARDWFDIKEPIESIIKVDLPPKARRAYETMEQELFAELESGVEIEAFHAGSKAQKLLQIGNGTVYTDPVTRAWEVVHDEKIEALKSLVTECNGESILVRYTHVPDKERILKAFPRARFLDDNPKTQDSWNAGNIPMLVAHAASAGHGLNLQHGGRVLCDYSSGYNLEEDEQIVERVGCTRQAQSGYDRAVYRYRLVAADTIEEHSVLPRIKYKMSIQDSLKNAVRIRRA